MKKFKLNQTHIATIKSFLYRFIIASIIFYITAFFTPGFAIDNSISLLLLSLLLATIDVSIVKVNNISSKKWIKLIIGFILAVIMLYIANYFVEGYSISLLTTFFGSAIYGISDLLFTDI